MICRTMKQAILAGILVTLGSSLLAGREIELPPRPLNALAGSDFARSISNLALEEREEQILAQVKAGNVPRFLRTFVAVTVTAGCRVGIELVIGWPRQLVCRGRAATRGCGPPRPDSRPVVCPASELRIKAAASTSCHRGSADRQAPLTPRAAAPPRQASCLGYPLSAQST
jgi:hypothetical protein